DLGRVTRTLRRRRLGDVVIRDEAAPALVGRNLRHRRRQRRLAMVHVADRTHIAMGLAAIELLFGHGTSSVAWPSCVALHGRGTTRAGQCPEPRFASGPAINVSEETSGPG